MVKDKITYISSKIFNLINIIKSFFSSRSNIEKRIFSSLILIAVAVYAIYRSQTVFLILSVALAILMAFEWADLTRTSEKQNKWRLAGFLYILVPVISTLKLRDIDSDIVLWMFFVIWATDIFAYFAGKNLGGPKLCPNISPNKTWSGLVGAIVGSMLIGFLSSFIFVNGNIAFFVAVSGVLAVISQLSDLLESKIKRIFKVKDSGNIIPGHGGVLDRMDGLILVAPIVLIIVHLNIDKFILS